MGALGQVQVPLSSELLWDMLHLADADGLVRLDYDMFVRLLTGVLESSMFRWGDSAVLPDSGKDAWVGGDTFGAGSGLYEMADGKLDDKSRGERGALGVGGVVEEDVAVLLWEVRRACRLDVSNWMCKDSTWTLAVCSNTLIPRPWMRV